MSSIEDGGKVATALRAGGRSSLGGRTAFRGLRRAAESFAAGGANPFLSIDHCPLTQLSQIINERRDAGLHFKTLRLCVSA